MKVAASNRKRRGHIEGSRPKRVKTIKSLPSEIDAGGERRYLAKELLQAWLKLDPVEASWRIQRFYDTHPNPSIVFAWGEYYVTLQEMAADINGIYDSKRPPSYAEPQITIDPSNLLSKTDKEVAGYIHGRQLVLSLELDGIVCVPEGVEGVNPLTPFIAWLAFKGFLMSMSALLEIFPTQALIKSPDFNNFLNTWDPFEVLPLDFFVLGCPFPEKRKAMAVLLYRYGSRAFKLTPGFPRPDMETLLKDIHFNAAELFTEMMNQTNKIQWQQGGVSTKMIPKGSPIYCSSNLKDLSFFGAPLLLSPDLASSENSSDIVKESFVSYNLFKQDGICYAFDHIQKGEKLVLKHPMNRVEALFGKKAENFNYIQNADADEIARLHYLEEEEIERLQCQTKELKRKVAMTKNLVAEFKAKMA